MTVRSYASTTRSAPGTLATSTVSRAARQSSPSASKSGRGEAQRVVRLAPQRHARVTGVGPPHHAQEERHARERRRIVHEDRVDQAVVHPRVRRDAERPAEARAVREHGHEAAPRHAVHRRVEPGEAHEFLDRGDEVDRGSPEDPPAVRAAQHRDIEPEARDVQEPGVVHAPQVHAALREALGDALREARRIVRGDAEVLGEVVPGARREEGHARRRAGARERHRALAPGAIAPRDDERLDAVVQRLLHEARLVPRVRGAAHVGEAEAGERGPCVRDRPLAPPPPGGRVVEEPDPYRALPANWRSTYCRIPPCR